MATHFNVDEANQNHPVKVTMKAEISKLKVQRLKVKVLIRGVALA